MVLYSEAARVPEGVLLNMYDRGYSIISFPGYWALCMFSVCAAFALADKEFVIVFRVLGGFALLWPTLWLIIDRQFPLPLRLSFLLITLCGFLVSKVVHNLLGRRRTRIQRWGLPSTRFERLRVDFFSRL
jgi:hypothetical protein